MSQFSDTVEARRVLEERMQEIPEIQKTLVENDEQLKMPDRAAHQQQIAGGRVLLKVAERVPKELDGLGLFQTFTGQDLSGHGAPCADYVGVGRISTGMGCPHRETDPDFLGLMLAFSIPDGRRVDFIGINDPTAPTDRVEDFIALLKATADAAGTKIPFGDLGMLGAGNLAASQARLLVSLGIHAGLRAPASGTCFWANGPHSPIKHCVSAVLDRHCQSQKRPRQIYSQAHNGREQAPGDFTRGEVSSQQIGKGVRATARSTFSWIGFHS